MKKLTLLSIVAATVLFVGCGEETKKAASEATTTAVAETKAAASSAGSATKEVAEKTVKAVKEAGESISDATDKAVEATKEAASGAVDSAKKSVAEAATAVADAAGSSAGADAYKKCAGCHGVDGQTKALGKSAVIAGQSKDDLVAKIGEYKAGTRDVSGMGTLMKGQVASMSDENIEAVATYISTLK